MTVLLNGGFREYLETETRMERLEIRNTRRIVRNLALKHSRVEDVDRSSLSSFERQALELYIDYRLKNADSENRIGFEMEDAEQAA